MLMVPLNDASSHGIAEVGGKAFGLSQLKRNGVPVPDGFVITTEAFRTFGQQSDPVTGSGLGLTFVEDLEDAFDRLVSEADTEYVAVRSSATTEDGALSHAGMHATYYFVARDRVIEMVERCWDSINDGRAYRSTSGAATGEMAVIVQRMVKSEVAGVTFTRDPSDPDSDHLVVESTWGLGAALVDGRVTPDRFNLSHTGAVLTQSIGNKRHRVVETADPQTKRFDDVDSSMRRKPSLDVSQLSRLSQLALACEDIMDAPQDVEWALEDDQFFILQSRPITTRTEAPPKVQGRWVAFKPILENFDKPLTPLTADLAVSVLPPIFRFIDGRLYVDFDMLRRAIPVRADDAALADLMLFAGDLRDAKPHWARIALLAAFSGLAYVGAGVFAARTRALPIAAIDDFEYRARAIAVDPKVDALQAMRRLVFGPGLFSPVANQVFSLNIAAARYFGLLACLKWLLRRYAPDLDSHTIAALCTGSARMWSTRLVRDIQNIARLAREDADARAWLDKPTAAPPETSRPGDFGATFNQFIDDFGHRCTMEVELAVPRWREDPSTVLQMIRNQVEAEPPQLDPHAQQISARDRMNQALSKRWLRRLANWLLSRIRYYVTVRENTRHQHARVFGIVRSKILLVEHELLADGTLRCAGDIFYLHWNELQLLVSGKTTWTALEPTVRARRIAHSRAGVSRAPQWFNLDIGEPPATDTLEGHCASPGHALGRVRIINDPTVDAKLRPGDVLVAPYTDPAWTPLFATAAAVVVEVGSYLSHAGTIARELKLPCVVDVRGCVDTLKDGQLVRVDATAGRVDVMEE